MRIAKEVRQKVNIILPVIVFILAIAVIIGWKLNIDWIRSFGSPTVATKPITAILFSLVSMSAIMLRCHNDMVAKTTALLLSKLALLIVYTVVTLETLLLTRYWDYILGFQLYKHELHNNIWPSLVILLNCSALAVANIYRTFLKDSSVFMWTGITVMFGGVVGLLGHVLNQPIFYNLQSKTMAIGIPTCLMMTLMGINTAILFKGYSQDEI